MQHKSPGACQSGVPPLTRVSQSTSSYTKKYISILENPVTYTIFEENFPKVSKKVVEIIKNALEISLAKGNIPFFGACGGQI